MKFAIPLAEQMDFTQSVNLLSSFREKLALFKSAPPAETFGWYPYDTLSNWWIFHSLWERDFKYLQYVVRHRPVIDIGCGDGDLALFLWWLGCDITAVDHPRFNFNGMRGVRALLDRAGSDMGTLAIDLDSETQMELPSEDYGLVLLLGILYHLKNPFYTLERLARRSRFCMLSTRIAASTPSGVLIQGEPVAYLLDSREANGDPTNYWIFSETGLARILKRSSWEVRASKKLGCSENSDPVSASGDERMFMVIRSKLRSAPAKLELQEGWYEEEANDWCWVKKEFSIRMTLIEADGAPEFELAFVILNPDGGAVDVIVGCRANGMDLPEQNYKTTGDQNYRTALPASINRAKPITLNFRVRHEIKFIGDSRDLGIIVPRRGEVKGTDSKIHLWIA